MTERMPRQDPIREQHGEGKREDEKLQRAKFHTVGKQQTQQEMDDVAVVTQDMLRSIRTEVTKKPTNKASIVDMNDI